MQMTFTAVFEAIPAAEGGGFMAYAAELPGAITEGETIEEARENLRDAIEQVLEANRELAQRNSTGQVVGREPISVALQP